MHQIHLESLGEKITFLASTISESSSVNQKWDLGTEIFLKKASPRVAFFFFFFGLFAFPRAASAAYGGSQARSLSRAVAAGLHQSHSNASSEPRLRPTPQLTATPDP